MRNLFSKWFNVKTDTRHKWIDGLWAKAPVGSEIELLGHKMKVMRHGFYDGTAFFDGIQTAYFDDSGVLRTAQFYPAELDGLLSEIEKVMI